MRRTGVAVIVVLAIVVMGAARAADPPVQSHIRFPTDVRPEELAVATDGSLWFNDEYHGLARVAPTGALRLYSIAGDWATDVAAGADGTIWFASDQALGRIDSSGNERDWGSNWITAIAPGPDGSAWFADSGPPLRLGRVAPNGTVARFRIHARRSVLSIDSLTFGPDGALWFTESGTGRGNAIGRMTTAGHYSAWPLPPGRVATRIAAGPDGALWFTEQSNHAIGRISTNGAISEFPLATGLSPYAVVAGSDGAVWFDADGCVGRITSDGRITTWRVRAAKLLVGLTTAHDGSLWMADELGHAVRRFAPTGVAATSECVPPSVTRRRGSVSATLVYRRLDTFGRDDWFTDARVRISRDGTQVFAEAAPRAPFKDQEEYRSQGDTASFVLRDLDGDGEPEVVLDLSLGGAHCCAWWRVYRYDRSRNRYIAHNKFWGDDAADPRLKDLNGDARPELVSRDERFAYAFTSYAGSGMPIRIWSYRRGVFSDATSRFPNQIRADAAFYWRLYLKYRKNDARGMLSAWAADEYRLGHAAAVDAALRRAAQAGYLECDCEPQHGTDYIEKLKAFLRRQGYLRRRAN